MLGGHSRLVAQRASAIRQRRRCRRWPWRPFRSSRRYRLTHRVEDIQIALWTEKEQGDPRLKARALRNTSAKAMIPPVSVALKKVAASRTRTKPSQNVEADTTQATSSSRSRATSTSTTGRGRSEGVYLQGNEAVRPIFRQWLQPFRDLGALDPRSQHREAPTTSRSTASAPGFQFALGPVVLGRTHHSSQDVFDRIQADDMKQASIIMAAFVYQSSDPPRKTAAQPRPKRETPTAGPGTTPSGNAPSTRGSTRCGSRFPHDESWAWPLRLASKFKRPRGCRFSASRLAGIPIPCEIINDLFRRPEKGTIIVLWTPKKARARWAIPTQGQGSNCQPTRCP